MLDEGYDPPHLEDDGKIHKFPAPDKKASNRSAWYVYFGTGGAFGDWVSGLSYKWHEKADRRGFTDKETRQRDAEAFAAAAQRFNEKEKGQLAAREKANLMWSKAKPDFTHLHQYLDNKGPIGAHGTRVLDDMLLVPIWDIKGKLMNLQRIYQDGTKKFLYGGEVSGGYYIIGGETTAKMWYVCEGFATGATIHELTGKHVIIAFNCKNLRLVAQMWRRHKPIIVADNDYETKIRGELVNPGLEAAMEIANEFSLDLVIPVWENYTDWNDLAREAGSKEAKRQLKLRVQP